MAYKFNVKSLNSMRLHDNTFGPTGLWQFANGAIGADSVGSATLTADSGHAAATEVGGYTVKNQALQDFIYYRNNAADFEYTGAMSFACMFRATQYEHIDNVDHDGYYRLVNKVGTDGGQLTTDDRYHLAFTSTGHIFYVHRNRPAGDSTLSLDQLYYDLYRWHHIAFTRSSDGRTVTIFLDGVKIGGTTFANGPGTAGTTYFNLGGVQGWNKGSYDGITQASNIIFNKELTGEEVAHLASRCLI